MADPQVVRTPFGADVVLDGDGLSGERAVVRAVDGLLGDEYLVAHETFGPLK